MTIEKIVIGTRQSDLARIQAELVAEELLKINPNLTIEYSYKTSAGDADQKTPLSQLPDKGVFTESLSNLLIEEKIDLAVHSWKDYPTEAPKGTEIVATLKRDDPRDMIFIKKSCWNRIVKQKSISVLSSSPRREYNIKPFLKWSLPAKIDNVFFAPVRGNIITRLQKLMSGKNDALIVAKAAITRILKADPEKYAATIKSLKDIMANCYWQIIPLSANPAAAAQAALAIEIKKNRQDLRELLSQINDQISFQNVIKEREILKSYGGGCHQKIGATILSLPLADVTFLAGETFEGKKLADVKISREQNIPPKTDDDHIWPNEPFNPFILQEALEVNQPKGPKTAYWIAKERALPKDWEIDFKTVVWCAGTETWKKLALRGIWVYGCADSLGEDNEESLIPLIPDSLKWIKLSHANAPVLADKELLATYDVKPAHNIPRPSNITHYFWKSAIAFKAMLAANPQILNAWNACGLGHTYYEIKKLLPDDSKLSAWYSYESWRKYVLSEE